MIKRENGQVYLTGRDEVIFSTVIFLMDLFIDKGNSTRSNVNRAIYYFRDQGMPLDECLFNQILARWDTRLAWGTPARIVSFPMDEHDPTCAKSTSRPFTFRSLGIMGRHAHGRLFLRGVSTDADKACFEGRLANHYKSHPTVKI